MAAFKAPLTKDDLLAIQTRGRGSADVRALLWEVKRLRALVLRADQLQRALGPLGGGPGAILHAMRLDLAVEPCVLEQQLLPELSQGAAGLKARAIDDSPDSDPK